MLQKNKNKNLSSAYEQSAPVFFPELRKQKWTRGGTVLGWRARGSQVRVLFPSAPSIMGESCPVTEKVHTNHGGEYSS